MLCMYTAQSLYCVILLVWVVLKKLLLLTDVLTTWVEVIFIVNRPRSIYQYSNMASRLLGQNCNFLNFFCLSIPKRDVNTKKATLNIEVWPESLGAMLEYWYIECGLLTSACQTKTELFCSVFKEICVHTHCFPPSTLQRQSRVKAHGSVCLDTHGRVVWCPVVVYVDDITIFRYHCFLHPH